MSRKPRHLMVLEEAKKEEYNLDKPSKIKSSLISTVQGARDDEQKELANMYAKSLGLEPPNKMSYEKGGKRTRKHRSRKNKSRKHKKSNKRR